MFVGYGPNLELRVGDRDWLELVSIDPDPEVVRKALRSRVMCRTPWRPNPTGVLQEQQLVIGGLHPRDAWQGLGPLVQTINEHPIGTLEAKSWMLVSTRAEQIAAGYVRCTLWIRALKTISQAYLCAGAFETRSWQLIQDWQ